MESKDSGVLTILDIIVFIKPRILKRIRGFFILCARHGAQRRTGAIQDILNDLEVKVLYRPDKGNG